MAQCSNQDCTVTTIAAKGMCRLHYRRTIPRTPDKPKLVNCDGCGIEILRHKSKRYPKSYCSEVCRHWDMWGAWSTEWPKRIPAPRAIQTKPLHPTLPGHLVAGFCSDCDAPFITMSTTGVAKFCSERCQRRTARRNRRAREHNAVGTYRFSDIMRQYTRQGRVCAYCQTTCDGLPDPEHVLALSRGGRNDMTNLVASCHLCNSDKCDLTLEEWVADRARRNLPTVNVAPYGTFDRYPMLVPQQAHGQAKRHPAKAA